MSRPITIIVSFLLTLVLGVVLIYPRYQDLQFIQEKIEELKIELQSKEEYLSNLNEVSEELKKYETELSIIDSALPSDPFLPALFDFLQKASSQNGLILKAMSPVSGLPSEGLKETRVNLKMTGSYTSLKGFLSVVENSARIIELESLSFSSSGELSPFDFDIAIKVYSY